MSRIKDHLANCMDLAENRHWAQLLKELEPWGDDAPNQLWGVVQFLADYQALIESEATLEAMAETEPELPSHSLPKATRELWLTPKDFRALAKDLERQSITAVNVGLALDLLARDYGHE